MANLTPVERSAMESSATDGDSVHSDSDVNASLKDELTEGILKLFRPAVEEVDTQVFNVRQSQVQLREHIDQLTTDLQQLSSQQKPPFELDPYIKKLLNCRRRVILVNTVLQNTQDRLNKLYQNVSRETYKKKTALENPPTT